MSRDQTLYDSRYKLPPSNTNLLHMSNLLKEFQPLFGIHVFFPRLDFIMLVNGERIHAGEERRNCWLEICFRKESRQSSRSHEVPETSFSETKKRSTDSTECVKNTLVEEPRAFGQKINWRNCGISRRGSR
jgi:hypothetical protein